MNIPAALDELCPAASKYAVALDEAALKYGIRTTLQAAHWLGQCAHESGGFKFVRENLNYSAEALMRTWPSRFTSDAIADVYARQPAKIANYVYASRMGNGNEASGDGARFIGRGFIQLTGRANYAAASAAIYGDDILVRNPDLVEQPEAAALTAAWFWTKNGLNALADRNDLTAITKRINGGTHGLADRQKWVEKFKGAL